MSYRSAQATKINAHLLDRPYYKKFLYTFQKKDLLYSGYILHITYYDNILYDDNTYSIAFVQNDGEHVLLEGVSPSEFDQVIYPQIQKHFSFTTRLQHFFKRGTK